MSKTRRGEPRPNFAQIEVCGLAVEKARCPFPPLGLGLKDEKKGN